MLAIRVDKAQADLYLIHLQMLYEVAQTGVVLALVLVVSMLSQDANNSSTTRHTKRS